MTGPDSGAALTGHALLSCSNLSKSFGGAQALDRLTLTFADTGIVAVIGPNGAGKTTFFNVVSGFVRADAGSCHVDGMPVLGLAPHRIAALGVARTFQELRLIRRLSTLENLCLAQPHQAGEGIFTALAAWRDSAREADRRQFARELLARLGLRDQEAMPAGELSYGQQKLLSLGCCLAMRPRILLLDEPLAGVHPAMRTEIIQLIADAGRQGSLALVIEHHLEAVTEHADDMIVMHRGALLARGIPHEVLKLPEVVEAYVA